MRAFLLLALTVLAADTAGAQQATSPVAPVVILFVGNSFTFGGGTKVNSYAATTVTDENPGSHTGGIPAIFKKFADEAGLHYEVHVEVVAGKDLAFHYEHALPVITQGKWDAVVLQGYSTEPLPAARGGHPDSFVSHAVLLEQAVHAARPATKMYLYETWAYPLKSYPADLTHPEHPAAGLVAMTVDLHAGYERASAQDGHFAAVVPVGDAWLQSMRSGLATDDASRPPKPGEIVLWDTDHKHPSVRGSYLCALVLFEKITGVDARKLGPDEQAARDLGISPDDAGKLQVAADASLHAGPP